MKILIGVDGSSDSLEAVHQAADFVVPSKDSIALYYSPIDLRLPAGRGNPPELIEEARAAMVQAVFDRAKEALPPECRAGVETIVGTRPAKQGLLAAADEVRADLIVVGARGTSRLQRLLLGSVSRSIVHASKVPVLVARRRESQQDALKVMWAYDPGGKGDVVAAYLNQLNWPARTRARILTVMAPQFVVPPPEWVEGRVVDAEIRAWGEQWSREYEAEKVQVREELSALCNRLPAAFLNAECHLAEGNPAEQILQQIADEKIDLVVLGAHAGGALSRLLLGSVSDAVLTQAPCSVLIVREKQRP